MNMPVFWPESGSTSSLMPFSITDTTLREAPRATREPAANPSSSAYEAGAISKIVPTPSSASRAS